ncbi:hypothetical protein H8Z72_24150 (plasmid) [Xanthomonas citri pv. citri]|nr:hypothetical protein LMG918_13765 [Xanthomonas euvesicatoria]QRD62835.1 hypothetical protein H8Z74_23720 [Xanthomonas citri pv. citri]QRD67372.1 hypothetical protein H8Z73_23865 [Xanthomonas citri pv. citri]QRD71965.1 hypothetical protein H8Z72_24150 [Xanthomonas citri pv. citri]QRD76376.1 hypothetical protein H8Z71_23145 [Xanthomonas citri pv. citri]
MQPSPALPELIDHPAVPIFGREVLAAIFRDYDGPGLFGVSDELTRELGDASRYIVALSGRPDAGPAAVWIDFGEVDAAGQRRQRGDFRARWIPVDGKIVGEVAASLDGVPVADFGAFARAFAPYIYADLPGVSGPVVQAHHTLMNADARGVTAAMAARWQSWRGDDSSKLH